MFSRPYERAPLVESSRTTALLRTHGVNVIALFAADEFPIATSYLFFVGGVVLLALLFWWLTVRVIPNDKVGVVEKLWSPKGSVTDGRIVALNEEAGYQATLLRGGLHFGYWRLAVPHSHRALVTVPQGQLGYVYARDGQPLPPSQTLGRVVDCNNFQDAQHSSREPGMNRSTGNAGAACHFAKVFMRSTRRCSS